MIDPTDYDEPLPFAKKWTERQGDLSRKQKWPVLGIFPSFGKLVLSAGGILAGIGCVLATPVVWWCNRKAPDKAHVWRRYPKTGGWLLLKSLFSLVYSGINICTLSVLGCCVETYSSLTASLAGC
jgi:hypothetical protein